MEGVEEAVSFFKAYQREYQADREGDTDLQGFDTQLQKGAENVSESEGFNQLVGFLDYVKLSDVTIANEIILCRNNIHDHKTAKKNEHLLDDLVSEYLENIRLTSELHQKVQNFIDSASRIADELQRQRHVPLIHKDNFKKSAEEVVKQVNSLRDRHTEMLKKLNKQGQINKMKQAAAGFFKKVVNVVFIGVSAVVFVSNIILAAMVAPVSLGAIAAVGPVMERGGHWLLNYIKAYESTLQKRGDLIKLMEDGTVKDINGSAGIMYHVDRIIKMVNDLLANSSSANDREIEKKLKGFRGEIQELQNRLNNCVVITEEANKKVYENYVEFKTQ